GDADPERPFSMDEFAMSDNDGTVLFTADLQGDENGVVGYRAKVTREILDLNRVYAHDSDDFFDPVRSKSGEVLLAPNVFYLLRTAEVVNVPRHLAAEIIAMDERIFEGRSHYAGFADPAFRDQITMEVRCHGMLLRKGQAIARVQYERLSVPPAADYRTRPGHYNKGNTFLSKHFKKAA
ncbi:2'-deoxycytidine 5'-triphosphate deaminase, partial [Candidatus Parcubacteria bacterium]|nr:2'-deoxycytidine 5'-triphosphate deaminase [Candidatus Parcubacteria bacterium]